MSVLNFCKRNISALPKLSKLRYLKVLKTYKRLFSSESQHVKVTVCGANGNVGQPLSLMLKQSPLIDTLAIHDINGVCGFGMELGHVDTKCRVCAYSGTDAIKEAFEGSDVVVVVAASPKTSHLAYSAMFEANANIIQDIAQNFSIHCPEALLAIATNPVNSLVPLASEVLKQNGVYNPKTVFGVTALNVVRANTFVADVQGLQPECVTVPVIGGHADKTIVPVLSQAKPCSDFTNEELEKVTMSIQNAHHDVIKAKSKQSATLSSAFAIARFVMSLVKAIRGQTGIVECAYVRSIAHNNAKYLATPLLLGPKGIYKNLGLPELSEYENCQLENAIPFISDDIKKGELFVGVEDPPPPCDPCDPDPKAAPCPRNWCADETDPRLRD